MVKNFHFTNSPRSSLVGASVSLVPIIRDLLTVHCSLFTDH